MKSEFIFLTLLFLLIILTAIIRIKITPTDVFTILQDGKPWTGAQIHEYMLKSKRGILSFKRLHRLLAFLVDQNQIEYCLPPKSTLPTSNKNLVYRKKGTK